MTEQEIAKLRKKFSHLTRQGRYKQIKKARGICFDCPEPLGPRSKFRCDSCEDKQSLIRKRYSEKVKVK